MRTRRFVYTCTCPKCGRVYVGPLHENYCGDDCYHWRKCEEMKHLRTEFPNHLLPREVKSYADAVHIRKASRRKIRLHWWIIDNTSYHEPALWHLMVGGIDPPDRGIRVYEVKFSELWGEMEALSGRDKDLYTVYQAAEGEGRW